MTTESAVIKHLSTLVSYQQRTNAYLARQEIEQIKTRLAADSTRLEPFGFKVYSQGDEDGIVEEIFRRLAIEKGNFCEIGVENGLECNTLYLLHKGWRGVWFEGNPNQMPAIRNKFSTIIPSRLTVNNIFVLRENINELISEWVAHSELDFLSIDVDGNDVHLLGALQSSPKVICVEYNAKFPANISKRAVYDPSRYWQGTDYMGSSLKGVYEIASRKGYQLVGTNLVGSNAFFVRKDLVGDLFPHEATPENLYNPARYDLVLDHYMHIGHRADFGPYEDLE